MRSGAPDVQGTKCAPSPTAEPTRLTGGRCRSRGRRRSSDSRDSTHWSSLAPRASCVAKDRTIRARRRGAAASRRCLWHFDRRCLWYLNWRSLWHLDRRRTRLRRLGSRRLEWRRPGWLPRTGRFVRVWHGDSLPIPFELGDADRHRRSDILGFNRRDRVLANDRMRRAVLTPFARTTRMPLPNGPDAQGSAVRWRKTCRSISWEAFIAPRLRSRS